MFQLTVSSERANFGNADVHARRRRLEAPCEPVCLLGPECHSAVCGCVRGARWRRRARVRRWRRARAAGGASARSTFGPTSASNIRRIRAVTCTLPECLAATATEKRAGIKAGETARAGTKADETAIAGLNARETARQGQRRGRWSANEHPQALQSPSLHRPTHSVYCRRQRSASLRPAVLRVRLRRRRAAR